MAYDEQRPFRPALHTVGHGERDARPMYAPEHSVGFQCSSPTPFSGGAFVSSPPTHSHAPAMPGPSRRPLPTPRTRPESMPAPPRQPPLVVQAPAPSRPAILAATLPTSPTAPPARRPLPTPVPTPARLTTKHGSIDLTARPASPAKHADLPSSFSRRTAPPEPAPSSSAPPPAWPRPTRSETHVTQPRTRNLPPPASADRRSTVSGVPPPVIGPPRPDQRRAESSDRAQPAPRSQSSPPRRPLPSSPVEPPVPPQRVPEDDVYEPMTFADPLQTEDDDNDIVFAKNDPTYGIRDLPPRARIAIANRHDPDTIADPSARPHPVRSATLPHPPAPSSLPPSPRKTVSPPSAFAPFDRNRASASSEPQSLTLRFASIGLAEERAREREKKSHQDAPVQSPVRSNSGPTSPIRQQQSWSANVPPLPRTPLGTSRPFFGTADIALHKQNGSASSSPVSLPTSPTHSTRPFPSSPNPNASFDRKSFPQSPRPPAHPQPQQASQLTGRQLEEQRARDTDIDLDDAPPPSLRRSPSSLPQGLPRAPAEITNDSPPRRQWTPSQDITSRSRNANGDGTTISYPSFRAGSHSPERAAKPLPAQSSPQFVLPRVSPPDGHRDEGDADDGPFGLSVVVSDLSTTPTVPAISLSEAPSVTVSDHGASTTDDAPSIVISSPKIVLRDPAQPQKPGPSFGSRHTTIQEPLSSHPAPGRASKRGLPPPPNSVRTNGLSCGGCNGPIIGRIVSAMGQRWHPNCFRCSICNELLEHVSSYERDGRPYCHLDYHETFAPRCFHCQTAIIDERFITLDDTALGKRTYHEQHFFCAECGDPFLSPVGPLPPSLTRTGELSIAGDGEFVDDDVGFTVYKGHPYCEACHVRLRMPKCQGCKKSIRDGVRAVEALGGKWCWSCFVCEGCKRPFEDPSFFLRHDQPFCEPCFSLMLRNEV